MGGYRSNRTTVDSLLAPNFKFYIQIFVDIFFAIRFLSVSESVVEIHYFNRKLFRQDSRMKEILLLKCLFIYLSVRTELTV